MKHYLFVCCLGLMLLGGCSTTYDIPREPTSPEFLEAIGELEGRTAMVYLFNGQTIELNSVTLQKDVLFGAIPGSDSLLELPLNEIQTVAVEDYGRGAGRGALLGLAIGTAIALPFAVIVGVTWIL